MKKLILILIASTSFAQVGINTTTPERTLHVAGKVMIDTLDFKPSANTYVVVDSDGELGYNTVATGTGLLQGVMNISEWRGSPLDVTTSVGAYVDYNVDLDLFVNVTIPDGTTAVIDIIYSVPIGLESTTGEVETSVGGYIEKNGVKLDNTESGFSITGSKGHSQAQNFYTDWVTNNTGLSITNTYALKGYINQKTATGDNNYRYKKYNIDDSLNDNWGIEKLRARVWRF